MTDLLTVDDLHALPEDEHWKYELLDGVLVMTPTCPGLWHQSCVGGLYIYLRQACPPHLKVMMGGFEYNPHPYLAVQPDGFIARRPIGDEALRHTPVLVVEVLAEGTRRIDLTLKQSVYQEQGVEHYWIVDPAGPFIEALRLVDGVYEVAVAGVAGELFEVTEPVAVSFDPYELLDE